MTAEPDHVHPCPSCALGVWCADPGCVTQWSYFYAGQAGLPRRCGDCAHDPARAELAVDCLAMLRTAGR